MAKANLKELLSNAKTLSMQIRNAKSQQQKIYAELAESFTPEEKQKQIGEATRILQNAKATFDNAKIEYKNSKHIASEMLAMVNAKHSALKKIQNHINIENNIATVQRNGFDKKFSVDIRKANWQIDLKKQMANSGIENGIARNICYKVSTLI